MVFNCFLFFHLKLQDLICVLIFHLASTGLKSSRTKKKATPGGSTVNSVTAVLFQSDTTLLSSGASDRYEITNHYFDGPVGLAILLLAQLFPKTVKNHRICLLILFVFLLCSSNIHIWDLRKNYTAYKGDPLPKYKISCGNSSARSGVTSLCLNPGKTLLYVAAMDDVIYEFNVAAYDSDPGT